MRGRHDIARLDTLERKAAVLQALEDHLTVVGASQATGVPPATIYLWMDKDPIFKEARQHARSVAKQRLEESMYQRAFKDSQSITGMFMLKSLDPERYQDKLQHRQDDRPNVVIQITQDQRSLTISADKPSPNTDIEPRSDMDQHTDPVTSMELAESRSDVKEPGLDS